MVCVPSGVKAAETSACHQKQALPSLIVQTGRSNKFPDQLVRAVLGHGFPRVVKPACPTSWWAEPSAAASKSDLLSDTHVQEVLGQASPRTCRTGQSEQLVYTVEAFVPDSILELLKDPGYCDGHP
ncbi:hypothetical protein PSTG_01518 [Puccinia striiformis f. sp. tritici PST-78]|uniref:Uncharacterized protein n=1 Tax=Puccinia striiformis f. sp. tritici PST-78 TaxID=1165861 RepID=A0A0L0W183_9BASI|nr:hypothetical protein PSTG_01518 [Puccinia striiformis f. sp. tritici PST-78]